jgi:hypothetical protein
MELPRLLDPFFQKLAQEEMLEKKCQPQLPNRRERRAEAAKMRKLLKQTHKQTERGLK